MALSLALRPYPQQFGPTLNPTALIHNHIARVPNALPLTLRPFPVPYGLTLTPITDSNRIGPGAVGRGQGRGYG